MNERCVVTGLGVICAIGSDLNSCWKHILAGESGVGHTTTVDTAGCYSDYAAEVRADDLDPSNDRASALCLHAAREAMQDAGLSDFGEDVRSGVIMGSCVGGGQSIEAYYHGARDAETVKKMPISAVANQVAAAYKAGGMVTNVANACAAGTISIAYANDLIRDGRADVILAGGADAFSSVPYAGFLSLHALAEGPCSPFNRSDGITLGEGAGVLVLESYSHAVARGAKIYCEVLGSGVSSDAHHITAPRPDGEGQMNAIRTALRNAGKTPGEIDYVNAHGTGTAKNDEAEFLSLHTVFDGENPKLSVSSTKAMTGHCLGAAGAIEAVFSVKALCENTVPPTVGFRPDDLPLLREKAGQMDFCPNAPREKRLSAVMSNSFAFGGNNASIIFGAGSAANTPEKQPVVLTGIGLVTPLGNGKQRYLEALDARETVENTARASTVGSNDFGPLGLKMAFYRKLDRFSQMQAVSGMDALRDAGYEIEGSRAFETGMIIGTSEGALGPSCDFQKLITERGNVNGSAFKFPNTVYNAAGGYLSICSGIKGYNVTVTNGPQSGLQSLAYGASVIENGLETAMLVTGSDENNEILTELYGHLRCTTPALARPHRTADGFTLSDGSVSLLLESEAAAKARGAEIYCRVTGWGSACAPVPFGTVSGSGAGLDRAIAEALSAAALRADQIDAVVGFANGCAAIDRIERDAIERLSGQAGRELPVISVKTRLGEARAASAALAAAHAALLLHDDAAAERDARLLSNDASVCLNASALRRVLVLSFGSGGGYTAAVLERMEE